MGIEHTMFPKIPRLNRDIVITEKIDGTNAAILIEPDSPPFDSSFGPVTVLGKVYAQSRTRVLREGETDNFGFREWVKQNEPYLRLLGPGLHFGEWWGQGIQRNYGLKEKRFSLFNVHRWRDSLEGVAILTQIQEYVPTIGVVPVLYRGGWMIDPTSQEFAPAVVLRDLATKGSSAVPGWMKPEGIVVYHTAGNLLFKATIERDEAHKSEVS